MILTYTIKERVYDMKKKLLSAVCALALVFGAAAPIADSGVLSEFGITASADESDFNYMLLSDGTYEIAKYIGDSADVTIPSEHGGRKVTSIGKSAFQSSQTTLTVTIPDSITKIGESAFQNCRKIKSLTIPNSVTSIGSMAFLSCVNLKEIDIPSSVTNFDGGAFMSTAWLKDQQEKDPLVIVNDILIDATKCTGNVTIPNGVRCVADWAFYHCPGAVRVDIPASVTKIGIRAFAKCTELERVTIPKSVTAISDYAFDGSDKVTVYGYEGSAAQTYAKANGVAFVVLPDIRKGDLNKNGEIDSADILKVKAYIKGTGDLTPEEFAAADIDDDGEIKTSDLLQMKSHMKGVSRLW